MKQRVSFDYSDEAGESTVVLGELSDAEDDAIRVEFEPPVNGEKFISHRYDPNLKQVRVEKYPNYAYRNGVYQLSFSVSQYVNKLWVDQEKYTVSVVISGIKTRESLIEVVKDEVDDEKPEAE